ncbi:arginase family protein [Lacisediminihabitans sp. G11-30]|uniref:Arginase family protein n=2 Tax=Lacisediminihabitans changchengi TaxID=2787634 RepID=A0A934SR50_9MICO|nr:arginase family protein [Lacisediminihabitans changchengi]
MRLIDGAEAIREDLPVSSTVRVDIPSGAGSDEGTPVQRLSSIVAVRDALLAEISMSTGLAITIGGDCGVELAPIGRAIETGDTAVLWLDAHPDLNTPASSPSGAFHGMVVRTLLGEGPDVATPSIPLDPRHLVLAGTRAFDEAEAEYAQSAGIGVIAPEDLDAAAVTESLVATGASRVYIHVDLDVLDPAFIDGVGFPEPFGVTLPQLLEVIAAAKAALPLAGAGVTEFAPAAPEAAVDDLGSILRIIGALAS